MRADGGRVDASPKITLCTRCCVSLYLQRNLQGANCKSNSIPAPYKRSMGYVILIDKRAYLAEKIN